MIISSYKYFKNMTSVRKRGKNNDNCNGQSDKKSNKNMFTENGKTKKFNARSFIVFSIVCSLITAVFNVYKDDIFFSLNLKRSSKGQLKNFEDASLLPCYINETELEDMVHPSIIKIWMEYQPSSEKIYKLSDLEYVLKHIDNGGDFEPKDCSYTTRTAVIIPIRDREEHLQILLSRLHDFLPKQKTAYTVFVAELTEMSRFSKGLLLNAAFLEISKSRDFDCYILHDVDFLPYSDKNIYKCDRTPRSLVSGYSTHRYKLPYEEYFGGVIAFTAEQFRAVNGFSNLYFGWGSEDDDLGYRVTHVYGHFVRYGGKHELYESLKHVRGPKLNETRLTLRKTTTVRMKEEGLNSVVYKLQKFERERFFTHLKIQINESHYAADIDYWMKKVPCL